MKKLLLSILAIAAIAACSKSEVEFEQPGAITFTPVPHNITKSMIYGTGNGSQIAFPTDAEFNVWAFYNPTTTVSNDIAIWVSQYYAADGASIYLDDKTFWYETQYSLWAGKAAAYYWPKVGSLAFAGYHPSSARASYSLKAEDATTNTAATNVLTFTDYTPTDINDGFVVAPTNETQADGTTVEKKTYNEDLMYFNLTTAYTKNNVTAVFKHALSWLTVNIQKSSTTPDDAKITVSSVKFTNVYPTGDGSVVNQETIAWTTEGNAAAIEVITPDAGLELSKTASKLKEPLIIPQDMTGNIEITYKIESTDQSKFEETKVLTLAELDGDTNADGNKWLPAKHYIYNITIGTEEILIDPKVTDWTDVTYTIEVGSTTTATTGN